ncbi:MAG: TetR/AcrR family transcriptional regulator [Hyphomicrobiales bacterium]
MTSPSEKLLDAAQSTFLSHGYSGASVDDIIAIAGVSKPVFDELFTDKPTLFAAMVDRLGGLQSAAMVQKSHNLPTEDALIAIAKSITAFVTTPLAQSMFRLCVAESARFPEVGRSFFNSGPRVMSANLGAVLDKACQDGDLEIDNKLHAIMQYWMLCRGPYFYPLIFKIKDGITHNERMETIREALTTFTARYGQPDFRSRISAKLAQLD